MAKKISDAFRTRKKTRISDEKQSQNPEVSSLAQNIVEPPSDWKNEPTEPKPLADLGPGVPCSACGCPAAWSTPYERDRLRCVVCDPPPSVSFVAVYAVIVGEVGQGRWVESTIPKCLDGRKAA